MRNPLDGLHWIIIVHWPQEREYLEMVIMHRYRRVEFGDRFLAVPWMVVIDGDEFGNRIAQSVESRFTAQRFEFPAFTRVT
jgi:hypothetical protein